MWSEKSTNINPIFGIFNETGISLKKVVVTVMSFILALSGMLPRPLLIELTPGRVVLTHIQRVGLVPLRESTYIHSSALDGANSLQ